MKIKINILLIVFFMAIILFLAIVSASPREKIEKTVPKEFLDKFDAVICSEDYENGKPDPEPYLGIYYEPRDWNPLHK